MPKRILPLTDLQITKAKTPAKNTKLFDGGGLYLLLTPSGGRLWYFKYRFDDKEKLLSFGAYPAVSLADARQRREDARRLLANGLDPSAVKKAAKHTRAEDSADTFEVVAREWHAVNKPRWAESHAKTTLQRLEKNVFPLLGAKPIKDVTLFDLKAMLRRIEQRTPESARRMLVCCNMIFRYALATSREEAAIAAKAGTRHDTLMPSPEWTPRIDRNPLEGLKPRDLLTTAPIEHHLPAITDPKELGALLRAIDDFKGSFVVKCALQLAPHVFQRPGDLRQMEWAEVDFDKAEWNIPIEKMKLTKKMKVDRKGEAHCVPLSSQSLEILREIQPWTQHSRYVFPGHRTPLKPMSEAALTAALHRMGYKDEMTWHGFRATARTILDEVLQERIDLIEHQLAHAVRDTLGRSYNRTTHLPERRRLMQRWSEYLQDLKTTAKIIPIRREAAQ